MIYKSEGDTSPSTRVAHQSGRIEEALTEVDQGLATAEQMHEGYVEAELYRLNGELLPESKDAESCFHRAIEKRAPLSSIRIYPTAHHWYGLYLSATGRTEEGVASLKRAQQLDPVSLVISATVGQQLYLARRYDEAIEQIPKVLEMDPGTFYRLKADGQLTTIVIGGSGGPLTTRNRLLSAATS
jgi:tetratricopeptide (TPR) repeat protein